MAGRPGGWGAEEGRPTRPNRKLSRNVERKFNARYGAALIGRVVHHSELRQRMSALGQKQTSRRARACPLYPRKRTLLSEVGMSALCQKQTSSKVA